MRRAESGTGAVAGVDGSVALIKTGAGDSIDMATIKDPIV